jgi:pyruvate/2-oxoglutarate dehydrogenase complex dihydrolipoamide acyltransferase (E2) component
MKQFKLPDLGEGVHEGQVIRVLVKAGDVVREDQPLMEVETDKAAVAIPSPFAGPVAEVHVKDGQIVHVGDVMVTFGAAPNTGASSDAPSGLAASAARVGSAAVVNPPTAAHASLAKPQAAGAAPRHKPASPFVRKLARTMGIDIETVNGSGPGGRVQRSDLEAIGNGIGGGNIIPPTAPPAVIQPSPQPSPFKGKGSSPSPAVAARVVHAPLPESMISELPPGRDEQDAHGPIRRVALSQARKTIAQVMSQSWTTIPHATDFDDADVTELERLRKGYTDPESVGASGRKITMLAFVVRAVVRALQRYPDFNAHYDADKSEVVYKRFINIALGVHTERGLVPMVIRDADRLTIPQLSDEINRLGEMARTSSFSVNDTRGGTYTISNAGAMGGSHYSTPIITPGQAAVLAVGRTRWMPWVIENDGSRGLAPRLIMPLSHSIDHRLLDGGHEIAFMQHVIGDLQNPARLLL